MRPVWADFSKTVGGFFPGKKNAKKKLWGIIFVSKFGSGRGWFPQNNGLFKYTGETPGFGNTPLPRVI